MPSFASVSWNCGGLFPAGSTEKTKMLCEKIKKHNLALLFITEVKCKDFDNKGPKAKLGDSLESMVKNTIGSKFECKSGQYPDGSTKRASGGVVIVWDPKVIQMETWKNGNENGRNITWLYIDATVGGKQFRFMNIYHNTSAESLGNKKRLDALRELIKKNTPVDGRSCVVVGDFNMQTIEVPEYKNAADNRITHQMRPHAAPTGIDYIFYNQEDVVYTKASEPKEREFEEISSDIGPLGTEGRTTGKHGHYPLYFEVKY